ncbi:circularly permutated Ras protein 1 [Genypterus blacodes]|uniref:circularly permutated Ras protein 1 n=1 Tax=Genypterus blacodes TaxID=154954 RepID=UPI003F7605D9
MEFACSHVVCNWRPDETGEGPPPLPPRRLKHPKPPPRPTSFPPLLPSSPSVPPPLPPRGHKLEGESRPKPDVNVVSLCVGKLVDMSQASCLDSFQKQVNCGKCDAALSSQSFAQRNVWVCEFCGNENAVCVSLHSLCSDVLYLPSQSDDDYQNLEDRLVVFCVDTSGSMGVTTEVTSNKQPPKYISRLEGIQDALQSALTSLLQQTPGRRVALVTFNNEVVIYGDGTSTPFTLRDWALVDYNHIWQQGVAYQVPHCISETYAQILQRVKDLKEDGATSLGPAVLASVAMASRYPGSKVVLCTDGRANIGLGEMDQELPLSSSPQSHSHSHFYKEVAQQAADSGVIVSVMTFEGMDCRLAEVGRLADTTGGRVNIVNIGTVASEIQSASIDNVLATSVTATLLAAEGVYFPHGNDSGHKLVKHIGNVTEGAQITVQFAVKSEFMEGFLRRGKLPFQLQLRFKTRDQQTATRIITEQRPVTTCSQIGAGNLNMAVLGVHCAQLCASLTMEGRVQEAQRQLKAQQELLKDISKQRPIHEEESVYGNWMETMATIFDDITTESQSLSDEAAKVVYQMKRVSSFLTGNTPDSQKQSVRKKRAVMEGM